METTMKRRIYIGGHMLDKGSQMQRAEERDMCLALGHEVYNPMDNKGINDKANAVQNGLAERIVEQDTAGIHWADTIIIEPQPHAIGSCVEVGQLLGEHDLAERILSIIDHFEDNSVDALYCIRRRVNHVLARRIYPHNSDIRRQNTSAQSGDRREYGSHQYVYGAVLKLTNGKGFYEMSEIEEELK